jgi:uncharacterized membrane protein
MPASNRLSLLFSLLLLILLPLAMGSAMMSSLGKINLDAGYALLLIAAIVLGSLINIPLKRIVQDRPVWSHPLQIWGLDKTLPRWTIRRRETVLAVNVGGCMVPFAISLFLIAQLVRLGEDAVWGVTLATAITTFICYIAARPVAGVGIVMPGFRVPRCRSHVGAPARTRRSPACRFRRRHDRPPHWRGLLSHRRTDTQSARRRDGLHRRRRHLRWHPALGDPGRPARLTKSGQGLMSIRARSCSTRLLMPRAVFMSASPPDESPERALATPRA